jgi:hypothetical protein
MPVNPTLITGLNQPFGIAVLGSNLLVANEDGGAPTMPSLANTRPPGCW